MCHTSLKRAFFFAGTPPGGGNTCLACCKALARIVSPLVTASALPLVSSFLRLPWLPSLPVEIELKDFERTADVVAAAPAVSGDWLEFLACSRESNCSCFTLYSADSGIESRLLPSSLMKKPEVKNAEFVLSFFYY